MIVWDAISARISAWRRSRVWIRRDRPQRAGLKRWFYGLLVLLTLLSGGAPQVHKSRFSGDADPAAIYPSQAASKGVAPACSDEAGWAAKRDALGKRLAALSCQEQSPWQDDAARSPQPMAPSSTKLVDLPLVESRAPNDQSDWFAVFLSGDGGWARFDKGMAAVLAAHGVSTVGWDSLAYYWKPKTPEQAATALEHLLRHYLAHWHKQRVLLIGYSFGADVLPFLVHRLPADLCHRLAGAAFFGLGQTATFEFHLMEWLGETTTARTYPVTPEFAKFPVIPLLCVYGADETGSLCPALRTPIEVAKVPGDHHFAHNYTNLVTRLLKWMRVSGQIS